MVFAEDSTKEPSSHKFIELHDTIQLSDTIDLKVRSADGKESTVNVNRQEFETQGFKTVPRKICPPPIEKISENCVKCGNNDVVCK